MKEELLSSIENIIDKLKIDQSSDGSWRYSLEASPITDVYFIILLRLLEIEGEEELIAQLANRIISKQAENGAWKLCYDSDGDLETTVEAYYGLLFSQHRNREDENMKKAEQFIHSKGGIGNVNKLFTLVLLAISGEIRWPKSVRIPPEFTLLPNNFPVNKYDMVGHARVHFLPIMIMANKRFFIKNKYTPNIHHLYTNKKQPKDPLVPFTSILKLITLPTKLFPPLSKRLYNKSIRTTERFLLERIEPDGTLYSYAPATIYLIFALMSLGYTKQSQIIVNAIQGLKSLVYRFDDADHLQAATSTVWDTAIISFTLQESNVLPTNPLIKRANEYILSRQHLQIGDWIVRNLKVKPGGWGFSDINTMYPDVDCTAIALRAIKRSSVHSNRLRDAWNKGLNWVLMMQNDDGGWPAFEKNLNRRIINLLIPFEEAKEFAIDPSTNDLTGRVLQFLGDDCGKTEKHFRIKKAIRWLKRQQEKNGSWYGRWGISYTHGTSAVVIGLLAVGVSPFDPMISKAKQWILSVQNEDGGWGEACISDVIKKYIPLEYSTPTQTAWALEMLIELHDQPTKEINRGIHYLINSLQVDDGTTTYPTGGGIPGSVYFYYHSLNHTWALLTLS
ncbi:squalene--hopene cyclase, partial [Alkalihalophilus pseudofirmus]